ncbi:MAG: hypothetical protein IJG82_02060 [Atopobiaceae bacterium]|nr:hypothetical protein [Atopobiaceae bacterium]
MLERIFDWVGDLLVDFLFGALYKVLYVSTLPKTTRYILAALVIAVYSAIEIFLIYEAVCFSRTGETYLMWLCIIAVPLFAALIIVGFLRQKRR